MELSECLLLFRALLSLLLNELEDMRTEYMRRFYSSRKRVLRMEMMLRRLRRTCKRHHGYLHFFDETTPRPVFAGGTANHLYFDASLARHITARCNLERKVWVRQRERSWWENEVLPLWDDEMWKKHFRMSRATLFEIAWQLRPYIGRQGTNMRTPIPVEKRVAVAIWWLATLECYREVAVNFGIGKATVAGIVLEVCFAIEHVLLRRIVQLGNHREVMDGFMSMGFPQVVGVVDGCHVKIFAPTAQGEEYINRKGFCSILLQGTCDHTGRFVDIEVGWSGKNHDAFVFRNSSLFDAMENGQFVPGNPTRTICGVQVPPLLLGGGAYPMCRWLMKPYADNLDEQKTAFNRYFNPVRNVVEHAFGRLKSRWRRLSGTLPVAEKNLVTVVCACVVLHNICETDGRVLQEPNCPSLPFQGQPRHREYCPYDNKDVVAGEEVRSAIAQFLFERQNLNF
ncbi:uncharacterized protein LOC133381611 [Rhineura floridana]|uniref:uncharacterized protein LOC133381611 n=1 Tax=Rhineura floridana TaxID=261503 RepID=UPI002AC869BA|nr:uncharacterized protein LOC133381611 [Rhineura floridana]